MLGDDVTVGAYAVVAAGARIVERCIIGPGCDLGPGVSLGADRVIDSPGTLHRDTRLGERCVVHSGA